MKIFLSVFVFVSMVFIAGDVSAEGFDIKGNLGVEYKGYLDNPRSGRDHNLAAVGGLEASYEREGLSARILIDALWDTSEEERDHLRADEAFVRYDHERLRAALGRMIIFWGALEAYNPVDIVNTQDITRDPLDVFKKGACLAVLSTYFEDSQLDLLVKLYEDDQEFPGEESPYNIFPPGLSYDEDLLPEESRTRPGIFLKYSGSAGGAWPLDYAFVLFNGYDKQRFLSVDDKGDLRQNAYIATKLMTFNTLVAGSTLLKFEAAYTDVRDNTLVSDYYQTGLGIEHTMEQVYRGYDLGLLVEHYVYELTDKDKVYDDLSLLQPYQNDLFLGFRLTFNDEASSEIVCGGIFDLEYDDEASYYLQYKTRLFDTFVVDADIRKIHPTTDDINTVYKRLGDHTRVGLTVRYYF